YLLLDHYRRPGWLYQFKIQIRRDGSASPVDFEKLWHTVRVVLFNQFFGTLPVLLLVFPLMVWRGMDPAQVAPPWFEVLWHLAVMLLVEEILFYVVHRALHHKYLYARIHKVHHEYKESIAITTHYVHYLEHIFGNLMPIFAGALIVGAHPLTILAWIGLAVTNALHSHSGYNFPWQAWSVHHDYHHFRIRGNYGVLGLLDWLLATDGPMRQVHARYVAEREQDSCEGVGGELRETRS
ncbi:MAG: sterol desaturase family protein, partial [Myxococcota bacterium]|nr:sterol desaturase family protein [Myxococcota bacterium]